MQDSTQITIDTYNTIARDYVKTYFNDTSDFEHIEQFVSSVTLNGSILEIGCGGGQFSQYLLSKGFTVTGIDLSASMLELAKEKVPKGIFLSMDMRALTFANGEFDGVIAPYSLIHVPDVEVVETLKGFHRVLKSSGAICIVVQEGEKDHMVDEPFAPGKQMFFNFFTPERIEKYVTLAGFSNISIKRVPCNDPYAMADGILYVCAKKI